MLVAADRAALLAALDDYMGERIDSAAFDERLDGLLASQDATVASIARHLWCIYDDCTDHLIVGTKPLWDQLARLRLVLLSGAEMHSQRLRLWHISQATALAALLGLGAIWLWSRQHLLLAWLAAGLLSMAFAAWHRRWRPRLEPSLGPDAWPFSGVATIRRALARVPGFGKPALPPHVAARRIRGHLEEMTLRVQQRLLWIAGAPLVLLFQSLPTHTCTTQVILAGEREPGSPRPDHAAAATTPARSR